MPPENATASPRRTWTAVLPAFVAPLPAFPAPLPNVPNKFPKGAILGAAALGSRGLPAQLRADFRQYTTSDGSRVFALEGTHIKQKSLVSESVSTTSRLPSLRRTSKSQLGEMLNAGRSGADELTSRDKAVRAQSLADDSKRSTRGFHVRTSTTNARSSQLPLESRLFSQGDGYLAHAVIKRAAGGFNKDHHIHAFATHRKTKKKLGEILGLNAVAYLLSERKPIRLQEHYNFYP